MYGFEPLITPVWLYVIYSVITFLVFCLFIFTFALLVGTLFKRPVLSTLLVLFTIVVMSALTQGSSSLQQWFNPFNMLDYRVSILGNRTYHQSGFDVMVVTNAQFIKPLIVPMLLSVLFYLGALRYQLKPEVIKGNILQNELEWRFIKDESLRFEIKKISSAIHYLSPSLPSLSLLVWCSFK